LLVGSDFGPDSLTTSGYPRTIREWVRGTDVNDAPVVFEGEKTDIAVSAYIDDQRVRGGGIYEVRTRALTSNTSKYWVRKVKYEHLLTEDDPKRAGEGDLPPFKELEVPDDSEIDFVGNLLMITLRSDWSPEEGKKYPQGSIIYVNAHKIIKYGPKDRIYHALFQPAERVACENYSVTQRFLVLSIMDNVKSKLEFYKLEKDANKLRLVGMDKNPQIRAINVRSVDPYEGDEFWLTTSGYIEPSTLWLADASQMDSQDKKVIRKTGSEGYIVRKLKALPDQFDSSNLEVVQKVVASKDGTEIPYFMIMKKGTQLDKSNPTLLYGYGGFEVTLGPHYVAPTGLAWLERGGVYVEANIRGGGEFGPSWHQVR
jgi:prolyl oligopeptidase